MTRKYTSLQKEFIKQLPLCDLDVLKAAELAGYSKSTSYTLRSSMRNEILQATQEYLSENATVAAKKLVNLVKSDVPILNAQTVLAASNSVLDRAGLGKQETLEVKVDIAESGVFILPAKDKG